MRRSSHFRLRMFEVCAGYAVMLGWHDIGRLAPRIPRRWLTGQVWKRHSLKKASKDLHRQDEAMRQDEKANVVLRHKKDTKGIPSSRFVSPTWKILKVTKVTTRNSDDVPAWVLHGPWSPWSPWVHGSTLLHNAQSRNFHVESMDVSWMHLMQRSCPRTFQFQTFRCTRWYSMRCKIHRIAEFQYIPMKIRKNKSPSATFGSTSLYLWPWLQRFNSFGSFTSQDTEDDGKTLAISALPSKWSLP